MVLVLSIAFTVSFGWWLAPRIFTYADRVLTRAHLNSSTSPHFSPSPEPLGQLDGLQHQQSSTGIKTGTPKLTPIDVVDEMARRTRSGAHARDAIAFVIQHTFTEHHQRLISPALSHDSIDDIFTRSFSILTAPKDAETHHMFQLLHSAYVNGIFIPAAVDHVVSTLRSHQAIRAELRTATTQSLLTARVLSYLPIVAFTFLLLFSSQTRGRIFDASMTLFLGIGIGVNRAGALWIRRIIYRTTHQPIDEVIVLTENFVASLRAGCSMTDALQRWHGKTPAGTRVATAIAANAPLSVALKQLPPSTSAYRLTQSIEAGYSDGLPLANTMHRMVDDARNAMRHHSDVLIRQLPTQLAFPLVLCILPSFLFITVVPLMINALAQLAPAISPPPIAIS